MSANTKISTEPRHRTRDLAPATLACMGVVFGDIGTSPLYTLSVAAKSASPSGHAVFYACSELVCSSFSEATPCFSGTCSVMTLNRASRAGPNVVEMATSAASLPRAITIRPIRGRLCLASNTYQRPPRKTSNHALKSIGAESGGTPISPR
jgi:K+ potassium transporter